MTGNGKVSACIEEGKNLQRTGDYARAAAKFEEALALDPANGQAVFELSKTRLLQEDYAAAKTGFARLLKTAYASVHVRLLLAKCCVRTGDCDTAYEALQALNTDAHGVSPEERKEMDDLLRDIHRLRAIALYEAARYPEALREIDGLCAHGVPDTQTKKLWAVILGDKLGRYEEAVALLAGALEADPRRDDLKKDRARYYGGIGEHWQHQGEYGKAIEAYTEGLRLDSENWQLHLGAGRAHLKRSAYAEALAALREGLRFGDDPELHFWLAVGLRNAGDYREALKELERAKGMKGGEGQVCCEKGENYHLLGEYGKAIEAYEQGLQHAPHNGALHLGLGKAFIQTGEFERASAQFREGKNRAPGIWELSLELGRMYLRSGDYARAIAEFNQGVKYAPHHYDLRLELGFAHARAGEYANAGKEYGAAVDELERVCGDGRRGDSYSENRTVAEYRTAVKYVPGQHRAGRGREYFINRKINEAEILTTLRCFSRPVTLYLRITRQCNLECVMCPTVREERATLPRRLFEKLWPLLPSVGEIQWIGGEVFMVDYFRELLERIHAEFPHITHAITTNGLMIDEAWAATLYDMDVHVNFSIDSPNRDTYERIRYGGSFERLKKNLELMNALYSRRYPGMKYVFTVNAVAMRSTLDDLALFPEFLQRHGIGNIGFSSLECHVSPGESIFEPRDGALVRTLTERIRTIERECRRRGIYCECFFESLLEQDPADRPAEEEKKNRKCVIPWTNLYIDREGTIKPNQDKVMGDGKLFQRRVEQMWESVVSGSGAPGTNIRSPAKVECIRPWLSLYVDSDGSVAPYSDCRRRIGNIFTDTTDDIWNGEQMQTYRRKLLDGTSGDWCTDHCVAGLRGKENLLLSKVEFFVRHGWTGQGRGTRQDGGSS